jgi:hypothetical protein
VVVEDLHQCGGHSVVVLGQEYVHAARLLPASAPTPPMSGTGV